MKRLIGLIMVALAIVGLVGTFLNSDKPTHVTGNAAYDTGQTAGRGAAPFVMVGIGLVGLWLLFQSDGDMAPAPPPPRRARSPGAMPAPGNPALRGGQNTFASNPALLRPDITRWLAANPEVMMLTGGIALAGMLFLFIRFPVGVVLILGGLIFGVRQIRVARRKFFMGDVCPAVVLYSQLDLVAVFTDLKASANNPRPAVKILKQPLRRLADEPAGDGMRLAAVALCHGSIRHAAWPDFSPEVIPCVIEDHEENARVLQSIPEQDWQALDAGLAQIPEAKPGLYRLWGSNQTPDAPGQAVFVPAKPWFRTGPAMVALSIIGAVVMSFVGLHLLALALRRTGYAHPPSPSMAAGPAQNAPFRSTPTQAGPFAVNAAVEANWAGGWIPGKITTVNPGGFSLMVQLEDQRFPYPIVLSTNQVRLR